MAKDKVETKRVKLHTSIAGHRYDGDNRMVGIYQYGNGDEVDLPLAEADAYIEKGYADPVVQKSQN